MTFFAGIAEFERTLILNRTTDRRLAVKARGVAFGRPRKMRSDQQEFARELVREGKSISAVSRTFDVYPATIYRVIKGWGIYAGFLFLPAAQAKSSEDRRIVGFGDNEHAQEDGRHTRVGQGPGSTPGSCKRPKIQSQIVENP